MARRALQDADDASSSTDRRRVADVEARTETPNSAARRPRPHVPSLTLVSPHTRQRVKSRRRLKVVGLFAGIGGIELGDKARAVQKKASGETECGVVQEGAKAVR